MASPPRLPLPPVDYLLIWRPAQPGGPWWWRLAKRWLDPAHGHITLVFFDAGGNAWVVIDPLFGGIEIGALPSSLTVRQVLAYYPDRTAMAFLPRRTRDHRGHRTPSLLTCVAVVKSITGMGGWSWTPLQLYRQIERMTADGHVEAEGGQGGRACPRSGEEVAGQGQG
jgi:hypothetical protein